MNISTIESILLALLVLDAIALTVLVLLQQGKGADVGAAFGSGSSNTMFGSLGAASFFTKATAWLAIGFFVITFCLAYVAKERASQLGTVGIPTATDSLPEGSSSELAEPVAPEDTGVGDVPGVEEDAGDVPGL